MPRERSQLKDRLYDLHARLCKAMASEKRLEILDNLKDGEMRVDELAESLNTSKANVSQHLAVLREVGVVCSRRQQRFVYYRVWDRRILQACALIRQVMLDRLRQEESRHREIVEFLEQENAGDSETQADDNS